MDKFNLQTTIQLFAGVKQMNIKCPTFAKLINVGGNANIKLQNEDDVLDRFRLAILNSCRNSEEIKRTYKDTETLHMELPDFKLARPLQIGDKIELTGGYDYDPIFLKNPPATKRIGTVIQFIKGQDNEPAAVVKLDQKITG